MPEQEFNPYAPPRPEAAAPWQGQAPAPPPVAMPPIPEALRRLQEFVANPANLAQDRRVEGARVPASAYVILVVGVLFVLGTIAGLIVSDDAGPFPLLGIIGFVFVLLGGVIVWRFLSFAPRNLPSTPAKTAKSFLQGLAMARFGYSWTCLAPTAREQSVFVPNLMPVSTVLGVYTVRSEPEMKTYASGFARSSGPTMRTMAVKNVVEWPIQGDVTRVSAELHFVSWPRWVSITIGIGVIACQLLSIVGFIILMSTRKSHKSRVTKTLLRAQNGVWYVYDANVFEDGVPI